MSFNLFGKKEEGTADRIFTDRVYTSSDGKMNACTKLVKEQPDALLIAWFGDTAKKYRQFFIQKGLDESCITEVRLVNISMLAHQKPVFIEHYPLHAVEIKLVENWQQKNIPVYSAMDEPLFKYFGSDKMIPFIKLLGIKENDAIEHSYVTESIVKGQQKIADRVNIEQVAYSQVEWMKRNLG